MTVPASPLPAARAALFAAIQTQTAADTTVDVIYDAPNPGDVTYDDIISVGDSSEPLRPYGMVGSGGAGWLISDGATVEVVVSAYLAGDQAAAVYARCYVLIGYVNAAVRGDLTLAGTVSQAYPTRWDVTGQWDDKGEGRFAVARCPIDLLFVS